MTTNLAKENNLYKFKIRPIENGSDQDHALVFIPGFLNDRNKEKDWDYVGRKIRDSGFDGQTYYLEWNAPKIDIVINTARIVTTLARNMAQGPLRVLSWPLLAVTYAAKWIASKHTARRIATSSPIIDSLVGLREKRLTFMAHSLGASLLFYFLSHPRSREKLLHSKQVLDILLLGGAHPVRDRWDRIRKVPTNSFINFYSSRDLILKYLYPVARHLYPGGRGILDFSKPCGSAPIQDEISGESIEVPTPAVDFSLDLIDEKGEVLVAKSGHGLWVENMPAIVNFKHGTADPRPAMRA